MILLVFAGSIDAPVFHFAFKLCVVDHQHALLLLIFKVKESGWKVFKAV